ncbi:MAG TPA: LytR C-terminal domain-containing protein [Sphingomicrobium sp.]|nr:LytR C-terminal domain-containing protein [Sphingomicrobium sp.]
MKRGGTILCSVATLAIAACTGSSGKLELRPTPTPLAAGERPVPFRIAEGWGQLSLGNVGLALESFRKALRDDASSIEALAGIATCYDRMARFDLSRRNYEAALAIAPGDTRLLTAFAASLDLQGLATEAASVRREIAQRLAVAAPAVSRQAPPAVASVARAAEPAALPGKPPRPARTALAAIPKAAPAPAPRPATSAASAPPAPAPRVATSAVSVPPAPAPRVVTSAVSMPPAPAPRAVARVAAAPPAPAVTQASVAPPAPAVTRAPTARPAPAKTQLALASPAPTVTSVAAKPAEAVPAPAATGPAPVRPAQPAIGRSVTIELPPARPVAEAAPARPVVESPAPAARAALAKPAVKPALKAGARLERMSLTEMALITTPGPQWRALTVERTPRSATVRFVPLRRSAARPAEIRLLNAARINRLAARTRSYLAARGWRPMTIGNAQAVRNRSIIFYPANRRATALTLSRQFGFAIAQRSGTRHITVLLGRDAARVAELRARG